MKKIKTVIALAIVSAIMATGLISAFAAYPDFVDEFKAGQRMTGRSTKISNRGITGQTGFSTNIGSKIWLQMYVYYSDSNGYSQYTKSRMYEKNNSGSLSANLSGPPSGYATEGSSHHWARFNNAEFYRVSGRPF